MNPTGDPLGPSGRVFPVEAAGTPLCPVHGTCTLWPPQRGSGRRSPKLIDPKGLHEVFWRPQSCVSAPWHPQVTSPCAWEPPDISLKPSRHPPEAPFARCAQAGSKVNPKELLWGEQGSILPALGFAPVPGFTGGLSSPVLTRLVQQGPGDLGRPPCFEGLQKKV